MGRSAAGAGRREAVDPLEIALAADRGRAARQPVPALLREAGRTGARTALRPRERRGQGTGGDAREVGRADREDPTRDRHEDAVGGRPRMAAPERLHRLTVQKTSATMHRTLPPAFSTS